MVLVEAAAGGSPELVANALIFGTATWSLLVEARDEVARHLLESIGAHRALSILVERRVRLKTCVAVAVRPAR